MKTFTIRINYLADEKNSEELYLKFCNRYFYNVQILGASPKHTVSRGDVTMVFTMDNEHGGQYDGYITLLSKDAEATKPAPDCSEQSPLVCIGSARARYLGDVSGHAHIRIEENYPSDLLDWLVKTLTHKSDLDTYHKVLEASASFRKLSRDSEFLRNLEVSLNDYITRLTDEECRTIAICNELTTTVRHHGTWKNAPEVFNEMAKRIKQNRRFTVWIDGEFFALRMKWPVVEDPSTQ